MLKPSDLHFSIRERTSQSGPASELLGHAPCPRCRVSGKDSKGDNLARYKNPDGSESCFCFVCSYYSKKGGNPTMAPSVASSLVPEETMLEFDTGSYNPSVVKACRSISPQIFQKYAVHVEDDKHIYPYYDRESHLLCGLKYRFVAEKGFSCKGKMGREAPLFGMNLFPKGVYKTCILTEGELDALSAYQMMSGRVPSLSIANGAQAAKRAVQANWDYLSSFETVYLCFDSDEEGRRATEEVAPMFQAGKVKLIQLPGEAKDANDVLDKLADPGIFNRAYNNAKVWAPTGIVYSNDLWEFIIKSSTKESIPYPWEGLNKFTYGIRPGELVTLCSGSGQGKTLFMREIAFHILKSTEDKVGLLFLEEEKGITGRNFLSLELNKPLHIPETKATEEELKAAHKRLLASNRVVVYDHFGSNSIDTIVSYVHYMAMVAGCKYVFLDHVSMVVSSQENGDERKALDEIMTRLRMLVQETNICLFVVTHLKRIEAGHENGAEISLNHLRGSAGIAQLSDMVIGFERNSQEADIQRRNTTVMRVLKNRPFGLTGLTAAVHFNSKTWRLDEVDLETYLTKGKGGAKVEAGPGPAPEGFQPRRPQ